MPKVLLDRYRCPDNLPDFGLAGQLSKDAGYFCFGQKTVCFGRSTCGYRALKACSPLYDVFPDVATAPSRVVLPFDPAEIFDNLLFENYASNASLDKLSPWQKALRETYYFFRPLMPVRVRRQFQRAHLAGWTKIGFPHWPVDTTVEDFSEQLLLCTIKAAGLKKIPFVWFWPEGARGCVVMTHDVEGSAGYDSCDSLMDLDDSFGIKASFQLVPEGSYKVSPARLQEIRDRGFEVNVQDLNHDGHLFRSESEFLQRARSINNYGRLYEARGFRAAVLYRNQNWYHALDFSYDMSVPNVAHLDPQRGGCCTVMPYFIGDMLELPLTTTQDYMLFHLLNDFSLDLWKAQTKIILEKNGLITLLVHPDYVIDPRARDAYKSLLDFVCKLGQEQKLWFALPGEIDDWWRMRSKMRVVERAGQWKIEGQGAERAVLAFAHASDGRLEYQVGSQLRVTDQRQADLSRELDTHS